MVNLSQLGEFGLLRRLRKKCAGRSSPRVIAGIGDDAAVIQTGRGKLLVTADMMIEGTHFDLSFTTFRQLGHKFLAVNVSDIFAMGGRPEYFLVSLGLPARLTPGQMNELYSGMLACGKRYGITIVGGDICASNDRMVLSGTLIGSASRVITRSGARAGDGIFVTGSQGDSAMGLFLLKAQKESRLAPLSAPREKRLVKRHLMPEPAPLASLSRISSMIDISDGLLIDLSHICDESGVGAIIYRDEIPLSRGLIRTAQQYKLDPVDLALRGGEDYTLLFTSAGSSLKDAVQIGEVIRKGRYIVDAGGRKKIFRPEGYEHFNPSDIKGKK